MPELKAKIAGQEIELPLKYKANDPIRLSAIEADVLNAAQLEFVNKRFKKFADAQKALGQLDMAELEVRLIAAWGDMSFKDLNNEGGSLPFVKMSLPLVKAATKIATAHVKDAVSRAGWKLSQANKENLEAIVQEKLAENDLYWHKAVEEVDPIKRLSPVPYEPQVVADCPTVTITPVPALKFEANPEKETTNDQLELNTGGIKTLRAEPPAPTSYEGPENRPGSTRGNSSNGDGHGNPLSIRIPPRGSGA